MYPTLLSIGSLQFHSYAVCLSAGFLTAVLLSIRENLKRRDPFPVSPLGGLWVLGGGLFGARLYYILQYGDPHKWYEAAYLWSGGLVYYGGFIGGFIGGLIYVLIVRAPVLPVADLGFQYVPLAHAIARVGCFLNGCCWGSQCELPWAVRFPAGSLPWKQHLDEGLLASGAHTSLPVHPTQLYESGLLLMIFGLLRILYLRRHPTGSVMLAYLFLYGIVRFTTEAFRGDSARPALEMTLSQMIALGVVVATIAAAVVLRYTLWRAFFAAKNTGDVKEQLTNGDGPAHDNAS